MRQDLDNLQLNKTPNGLFRVSDERGEHIVDMRIYRNEESLEMEEDPTAFAFWHTIELFDPDSEMPMGSINLRTWFGGNLANAIGEEVHRRHLNGEEI